LSKSIHDAAFRSLHLAYVSDFHRFQFTGPFMLTQSSPFLNPVHATADLAERLHALARDVEHLRQGQSVSPDLLQTAPVLEYWVAVQRPEGLRLIGQVDDRMVITSPLWFADPAGNWIRTLSRFYRLGPPANPCEAALILSLKIEPHQTHDDTDAGCDA
jgi:hypothetical protein